MEEVARGVVQPGAARTAHWLAQPGQWDVRNNAETLSGLCGMFAITREVDVIHRWVDGSDVLTWFELWTATAGPMAIVNWSHVEDGRITRIRVTFDPRPMLG